MFTILKVRENLRSYDVDPGWYDHPAGTVAGPVGDRAAAVAPTPERASSARLQKMASSNVLYAAVKANSCASMWRARK
jgi:hypothetical protein